mmetsp:Transcript_10059/g.15511  ORF Transcript_10059/g.15511 Transcript_10059/m.15511 type:complete len:289 (+) Transcript_10059:159-1025(+)|eukprot:CAMPEP_0195282760 /NCGR_PEP_ID=MMETSP0707-20130614/1523_1 /TAXON_ID=33640 /ORGANISM="Asterionellopsis glacialis, Strain CCMP134" /LENGTH=288 /DNA_ID=CAMNT_0040341791 /DNA_START=152 /DNA_END=1018 /DNA_ORIENTATION=+
MEVARTKKRRLSSLKTKEDNSSSEVQKIDKDALCSFCNNTPAALLVQMPSSRKRKEAPLPYCLLHYYTTRAVRVDTSSVSVLNQDQVDFQLENGMQELFAEAFTELQQELGEESARSFHAHKADPLAVLMDIRGKPKKRPQAPAALKTHEPANKDAAGGFFHSTKLPERLLRNQEHQQLVQAQQVARVQEGNSTGNPYKRRKPAKMSIWNMAMNKEVKSNNNSGKAAGISESDITCSCGSKSVVVFGNITGRNTDMTKGETWGNKERSDTLITRYQCSSCGKIWNVED